MNTTNQQLSQDVEMKAVALLARGDSANAVARELHISPMTVGKVKARNKETLDMVTKKLIIHKTKQAKRLLDKSHDAIERRLSADDEYFQEKIDIRRQYLDGEINAYDYKLKMSAIPNVTLAELTSLAKEMFNQSQIEAGEPTGITRGEGATTGEAKQKLEELIEALHQNDEVKMLKMLDEQK